MWKLSNSSLSAWTRWVYCAPEDEIFLMQSSFGGSLETSTQTDFSLSYFILFILLIYLSFLFFNASLRTSQQTRLEVGDLKCTRWSREWSCRLFVVWETILNGDFPCEWRGRRHKFLVSVKDVKGLFKKNGWTSFPRKCDNDGEKGWIAAYKQLPIRK